MLITAAVYAGTTHRLSIALIVIAAAIGAIVGDNIGYAIGRLGGYPLLHRYGRYVRLDERRLTLGQYLFRRHGSKLVFFGRFVAILRAFAAFLSGANLMPWRRFLFFNALGGIVWSTTFGLGGYLLGQQLVRLSRPIDIALVAAGLAVLAAFFEFLRRNEDRLIDEAERAIALRSRDSRR